MGRFGSMKEVVMEEIGRCCSVNESSTWRGASKA